MWDGSGGVADIGIPSDGSGRRDTPTVDDGSVDDGISIIDEASVALVPIGGGVVDAVASIVPVGAGTC